MDSECSFCQEYSLILRAKQNRIEKSIYKIRYHITLSLTEEIDTFTDNGKPHHEVYTHRSRRIYYCPVCGKRLAP